MVTKMYKIFMVQKVIDRENHLTILKGMIFQKMEKQEF